jgi:two-component sensor histidine kinase
VLARVPPSVVLMVGHPPSPRAAGGHPGASHQGTYADSTLEEHVPTFDNLVREHADLSAADVEWLHLLMADWQLLADLSFADLVLWVPDRRTRGYVAVAQMRPTTGPTVYWDDVVGERVARGRRPQLDEALDAARICRERDPDWRDDVPVREETVPVVRGGTAIAVVSRHTNLAAARTPSRLELTYLRCADDLAQMIAEGTFPFPEAGERLARAPRVGDGMLRLDADGVVSYASPNGLSAYRRLGLAADLVGAHLGETTAALIGSRAPVDEAIAVGVSGRAPRSVEVDASGATVALRAIPLLPGGERRGAVVLVRDVTELRRRERELVTKDATIREIHHRVKNNLQTVAALLRLQARRLDEPSARAALEEAVRRVASIAVVHETLSQSLDESVAFDAVADRLVAAVCDVAAAGTRLSVRRQGDFGVLPAAVATPLALALNELLVNAVEHGLRGRDGSVVVDVQRPDDRLRMSVTDDGAGLPEDFTADSGTTLGLQIVRSLVEGELGGRLEVVPAVGGGTRAVVDLPVAGGRRLTGEAARLGALRYGAVRCGTVRREAVRGSLFGFVAASGHGDAPAPWGGRRRGASVQGGRKGPPKRRVGYAERARLRAVRRLRARRSSSLRAPQTPASWPDSSAHRRQGSATGHRLQTALASSICNRAGPVLPIGKNSSGSSSRQAARWRQSMRLAPRYLVAEGPRPLSVRSLRVTACERIHDAHTTTTWDTNGCPRQSERSAGRRELTHAQGRAFQPTRHRTRPAARICGVTCCHVRHNTCDARALLDERPASLLSRVAQA